MNIITLDKDYAVLLTQLKEKIRSAQLKAALAVNTEVIQLYWYIGKQIIEKQQQTKWGSKLIETLSHDLRNSFPETKGFAKSNLKYMRVFAQHYPDPIGQQPIGQLPWGHIVTLLSVKDIRKRNWYIQQTIENDW